MIGCLKEQMPFAIFFFLCNVFVTAFLRDYFVVTRGFSFVAELAQKGIVLPKVSNPVGNYVSVVRSGNMLYLCNICVHRGNFIAGALPLKEDGSYYKGKVFVAVHAIP